MNLPLQLKSGALLQVGIAPFGDASRLFKVIAKEIKDVEVNLTSLDIKKIAAEDINSIKNVVFQVIASDEVEAAMFKCAERCTYNQAKITRQTFDPEDARGDYLVVAWEVIKTNLAPFFKNLDLKSLTPSAPSIKSQV